MKSQSKFVFEIILVVTVVVALSVIPRAASAAGRHMHGPPPFAEFDANGDGAVSEEEFDAARARHMAERAEAGGKMRGASSHPAFADADTDGDGALSEAELEAMHETHMAAMRKQGGKHHGDHHGGCKEKAKEADRETAENPES